LSQQQLAAEAPAEAPQKAWQPFLDGKLTHAEALKALVQET
jgi:hypothetical protein